MRTHLLTSSLLTKLILPILLSALLAQSAFACFQETHTRLDGTKFTGYENFDFHDFGRSMKADPRVYGAEMEQRYAGKTDFDSRNDYALGLIYQGKTKEGIEILQSLEKEVEGLYMIAANLGTAYELAGNNEEAIRWIKEGIRRNPQSHHGTEWLHVKILEAKLACEKDPNFFKNHSVLDLNPEKLGLKVLIGGKTMTSKEVTKAILYQLKERMQFVKPPEPAVASLLFDYAAIAAATTGLEDATPALRLATQYGYPADRVTPLLERYEKLIKDGKK